MLLNQIRRLHFSMQKFTAEELKKRLTPIQFQVTQQNGTEPPFQNPYHNLKEKGLFNCVVCGVLLFSSEGKFDSGCGWPAFFKSENEKMITEKTDKTHGMTRVEVRCAQCDAHLGHKFDDGPAAKGGVRYCINSASLNFKK